MTLRLNDLLRSLTAATLLVSALSTRAADPRNYAVELSATVQAAPPRIDLKWVSDANATGYSVYRKAPSATGWTFLTSLSGNILSWSDLAVANGSSYEYAITKTTSAGYSGSGYLLAGINAPAVENRGKVVLIVDNTYAAALSAELARLQQDLVGDGWIVLRHDVSRTASVTSVKNLILADYNSDPTNVKSVFLFGHVPVPYSGNLNPPPDGHPDHQGAWPADAYYGEVNGVWTDSAVSNTSGARAANQNIPGDGKFDQSDLPSDVDLQVGRVDLANMTCFSNKTPSRSELDLLRAYLNKDHAFRIGQVSIARRGLIRDTFGDIYGENFASSGWRNSASFFGAENSAAAPYGGYFSTLRDNSYLWSYGAGGGTYTSCDGIGTSDDFATTDVKTVFTGFLGSYFGDWDTESAFLRAPLGSGNALASVWAGRPHWFLHHMALGETIGYSAKVSQNNKGGGLYSTQNWGTYRTHIALMGDPTLRLHPVLPVVNLGATTGAGVSLNWNASPDSNIQGYLVYRGTSLNGPFTRISGNNLLSTLGMFDSSGTAGSVYMVRAVKLEQSAGGTYYNPSIGTFITAPAATVQVPTAPTSVSAVALSSTSARIQWVDTSSIESGFNLMRKVGANGTYTKLSAAANAISFTDSGLAAGTQYFYKLSAWNAGGESPFSTEVSVTTPAVLSNGPFLGFDTTTSGSWKDVYGSEGYNVIGDEGNYFIPVIVTPNGGVQWVWTWASTDLAAMQRAADDTRLAACWYSATEIKTTFSFSGSAHHKLTVYCLDWSAEGRQQVIEILDANQNVLQSKTVANFQKGTYLSFDVTGTVIVRVRPLVGNAVVSGFFIDPLTSALPQVATPVFTPGSSILTSGQTVSLSSTTAGATIRYTTDGTVPTTSSPLYTGPIRLTASAILSARAFASGMADSSLATASFIVQTASSSQSAKASFLGVNTARLGNWKSNIGFEGYIMPGIATSLPASIVVNASGKGEWTWTAPTTDIRALETTNGLSRNASCGYGADIQYDINFTDGKTHTVAAYFLDWDRSNRIEMVEILDANTKAVLHTSTLSNFGGGTYMNYAVKGRVILRITLKSGVNAVFSGIFFDPSTTQL